MNNTYFGANHSEVYVDYTYRRIFQEPSLSELETRYHSCDLEETQIIPPLALVVFKILDFGGNILWSYTYTNKNSPLYVFEDKICRQRIPIFYKNKVHFMTTYIWETAVPCESKYSHRVVQLYPNEKRYYLLTSYPTLMPPSKKVSPESIHAIARNPNIYLQSRGIYSKSDIEYHLCT